MLKGGVEMAEPVHSRAMLFPPVGIAHVATTLLDFIAPYDGLPGLTEVVVGCAAQPNSAPHLGTTTTTLCAFALAQEVAAGYRLPVTVLFDTLDNAPAPNSR